jgi:23S rRNA (adenine2503-C2)-methyltransferase
VRLLGQRKCKRNPAACNATIGPPFEAPDPDRVLEFEDSLRRRGLSVTLRKSMGAGVAAACWRLAGERGKG